MKNGCEYLKDGDSYHSSLGGCQWWRLSNPPVPWGTHPRLTVTGSLEHRWSSDVVNWTILYFFAPELPTLCVRACVCVYVCECMCVCVFWKSCGIFRRLNDVPVSWCVQRDHFFLFIFFVYFFRINSSRCYQRLKRRLLLCRRVISFRNTCKCKKTRWGKWNQSAWQAEGKKVEYVMVCTAPVQLLKNVLPRGWQVRLVSTSKRFLFLFLLHVIVFIRFF